MFNDEDVSYGCLFVQFLNEQNLMLVPKTHANIKNYVIPQDAEEMKKLLNNIIGELNKGYFNQRDCVNAINSHFDILKDN